jgi:hypothetical protein
MMKLDPVLAKKIIYTLGTTGTPPEFGVQYFTVGLDRYLKTLEKEYLDGIVKEGLSAFKLVVGSYGGGKTHFLYAVRDLAFKYGYITSYIPLNPAECPFDKLELVYKQIIVNLTHPVGMEELAKGQDRGIEALLRMWFEELRGELLTRGEEALREYARSVPGTESTSFSNAIRRALLSLIEGDEETFNRILLWLKGEGFSLHEYSPLGILERIDKRTAFRMIRSLSQWIRNMGYSGIVLLFDEAERASSLSTSKERRQALDNLRQIVDECSNVRLPSTMIFYAIPDERQLLDGKADVYEALRQRLRGVFTITNPSGVMINLEDLGMEPLDFLIQVGEKLSLVYETAFGNKFETSLLDKSLKNLAEAAYEERYADISYRRLFVKGCIEAFHRIRETGNPISEEDSIKIIRSGLTSLEGREIEEIEGREF